MSDNYSSKTLEALEAGQIEESDRLYSWALRKDDDETLYNLAGELFALGFDKKALRIYEKLQHNYPEDDELKVLQAEILVDQGENDTALELLNSVEADSDFYVESLMVSADLYQTEELYEVSKDKLLEAQRIVPGEPAVQLALGELYFNMQDYSKAVNCYLGLIKNGVVKASQINIVERLAASYAASGKFEKAIAYYDQIHEEDLTPDILMQEGITYLQIDENERAQEILEKVIDMDASYSSVYPYLISAYQRNEQWNEGLKAAQAGIAVDEYNPNLYLQAAEMAEHTSEDEVIERYLKKAFEIAPDNTEALIRLTDFYNRKQRFEQVVALDSDDVEDPQLQWNFALAFWKTDQLESAKKYFDSASENLKNTPAFLLDYFQFLKEIGNIELATMTAREYVRLVPNDLSMNEELEQLEDQGY